jgi:hypothetical protein
LYAAPAGAGKPEQILEYLQAAPKYAQYERLAAAIDG